MIQGIVDDDGTPVVQLVVAEQTWLAIIDTGFNGDLELPEALRPSVNPRLWGPVYSDLAGGQSILEDAYSVDFPFDGEVKKAEATFTSNAVILIGTHLIKSYHLDIHFPNRTVRLERVA